MAIYKLCFRLKIVCILKSSNLVEEVVILPGVIKCNPCCTLTSLLSVYNVGYTISLPM